MKLPSYQTFVERSMRMVDPMLKAILEKNLISLGHLMEESSDLLHATIRDTGYDFYLPSTYEFLEKIKKRLRMIIHSFTPSMRVLMLNY